MLPSHVFLHVNSQAKSDSRKLYYRMASIGGKSHQKSHFNKLEINKFWHFEILTFWKSDISNVAVQSSSKQWCDDDNPDHAVILYPFQNCYFMKLFKMKLIKVIMIHFLSFKLKIELVMELAIELVIEFDSELVSEVGKDFNGVEQLEKR